MILHAGSQVLVSKQIWITIIASKRIFTTDHPTLFSHKENRKKRVISSPSTLPNKSHHFGHLHALMGAISTGSYFS